jgi:GAF domain-containing protein
METSATIGGVSTIAKRDFYHALYEVARTINSTLSLPVVLNLIVESTAKAMDAKACSLRLLTPDREKLEIGAVYGLSPAYVAKGPVDVSKSQVAAEALRGKPIVVSDAFHDHRLQYQDEVMREGIASMLIVPVTVKGVSIGILRVYTAQKREFTPEEVEFVEAIANLGGIAIDNARTYEALEEQFEAIRREKIPWAENFRKPRWR